MSIKRLIGKCKIISHITLNFVVFIIIGRIRNSAHIIYSEKDLFQDC